MKAKSYPAAVVLAYDAVMRSAVFRIGGNPIDLPRALGLLGDACHKHDMDENAWSVIGEFTESPLGDLIVGAYWALTEWHAGQHSPSYAALCALGRVFKPGPCASGPEPEPESGEMNAYELITSWFESHPLQTATR